MTQLAQLKTLNTLIGNTKFKLLMINKSIDILNKELVVYNKELEELINYFVLTEDFEICTRLKKFKK
jgi:hypothetical protein